MAVFLALLLKLLPLYILIALGYVSGRYLRVQRDSVAFLLLYAVAPIVVFEGARTVALRADTLALPFFFLVLCSALCAIFYIVASFFWKDATRNLAAFASADGNTGYFGIPAALALFSPSILGVVVLGSMGFLLFESTFGFFILARGKFSLRQSMGKVLRLPLLYAFLIGLAANLIHLSLLSGFQAAMIDVRGAYTVLGMMTIGLGLSGLERSSVDLSLVVFTCIAKFVCWPLLMAGIIAIDTHFLHFFSVDVHHVMMLLAVVPLAVNTVALSAIVRAQPGKAAFAVLVSTVVALFFIPFVSTFVF